MGGCLWRCLEDSAPFSYHHLADCAPVTQNNSLNWIFGKIRCWMQTRNPQFHPQSAASHKPQQKLYLCLISSDVHQSLHTAQWRVSDMLSAIRGYHFYLPCYPRKDLFYRHAGQFKCILLRLTAAKRYCTWPTTSHREQKAAPHWLSSTCYLWSLIFYFMFKFQWIYSHSSHIQNNTCISL